jgi:hypothetical protein
MNYFTLLQRLSVMLSEIGHNLPRFLFYKHILPTNRMAGILSELYAAIVEFLHPAVAFFRRRRLSKKISTLGWVEAFADRVIQENMSLLSGPLLRSGFKMQSIRYKRFKGIWRVMLMQRRLPSSRYTMQASIATSQNSHAELPSFVNASSPTNACHET